MSHDLARKRALRDLARRAGLQARPDLELLDLALTHESYAAEHPELARSNERLEFLGDAIVGAVVAGELYDAHPERREGQLSRMRASLVSQAALARSAERLDIGPLIRLGRGERTSGGAKRASVLADVFEALVGAAFQMSGMEGARRFVRRNHLAHAAGSEASDPKTTLQELVQAKFKKTPHYAVTAQSGPPHARVFTVSVQVGDRTLGSGSGSTKKQAQSNAAREALAHLP
ncbi:MAG TPA: ribonuclease III [Candidatus Acidoferrales bacterium]|nr:ribonuclease III [Candidatus Acidoferrales bacterium]